MAFIRDEYVTLAVLIMAAWLFVGCITVTPTPSPTPAPTATPTPIHTPTPTPAPTQRQCPANCSDGNPCTSDECGAGTGFVCRNGPLDGPQPGCSGDAGNCTEQVCVTGACMTRPAVPCCGNGVCEEGEGCGICAIECPCGSGTVCCENACAAAACTSDAQCNDNDKCTRDVCANNGTCSAACQHIAKPCYGGDGCCPAGCDYVQDNDCPAYSKGQSARTSNGLNISAELLFRRSCIRPGGIEVPWLALRITIRNDAGGEVFFDPANVTVIDMEMGRTLTSSNPTGTDCYTRDVDFILTAGSIPPGESVTKLIYYDPMGMQVRQTSKKVVVAIAEGERYIWLIAPEG